MSFHDITVSMIGLITNCLLGVFGGMVAAVLAGLVAWNLCKLLRMPELGPWAVLALLLFIPGAAEHTLGQMMMLFLGIIGLALLSEGPVWRARNPVERLKTAAGTHRGPKRGHHFHLSI